MAQGPLGTKSVEVDVVNQDHGFRADVEGLRALAIITVLAYHFQLAPFRGGYVGVDVFFVISGFVITRHLLNERAGQPFSTLLSFYGRRIRRILPAGSLCIVVTVVATYVTLGSLSANAAAHDAVAAGLFFANVHYSQIANSYLLSSGPTSPLLHFWSLSIEEQFYLVWPTLFLVVGLLSPSRRRRGALAVTLAAIVVASMWFSQIITSSSPNSAYYSSFARAGELALGCLVAVGSPWWRLMTPKVATVLSWFGLLVIVFSACAYNDHTRFPGLAVLVPTLGTAVVIIGGGVVRASGASLLLSRKILTAIGALSFSLYLWHWPIFDLVILKLGHLPSWPWRVALIIPTTLASYVSYHLVENPVRRRAFWREHRQRSYALGVALVALVLVTSLLTESVTADASRVAAPSPARTLGALDVALTQAAHVQRLGALVVPLTQLRSDVPFAGFDRGCLVAFNATSATGSRPANCYFGDTASARTLVLFGDSTADMWIAAFDALGRRDHFRVELIARASCQLPDLHLWNPALHAPGTACSAFRQWALSEIARQHPFLTVATDYEYGLRWNYADQLVSNDVAGAALTRTLANIARFSTRTILLAPPPAVMSDPALCLSTHASHIASCDAPLACLRLADQHRAACAFDPATGRSWAMFDRLAMSAARAGATYVNLTSLFCNATTCPAVVSHIVVNFDLRHVSQHYSLYVNRALGQLLFSRATRLSSR